MRISNSGREPAWHLLDLEEVGRLLGVDPAVGLDGRDARRRLDEHGPNIVTEHGGTPWWRRLAGQFSQPLVLALVAAVAVTSFLGEWTDASVIAAVVVLNALIGFLQESKAESAIKALGRMVKTTALVLRGGERRRLGSEDLVPGDVVFLAPGDRVPADARVGAARGLSVDESALTGESVPVFKGPESLEMDAPVSERTNIVHAGTLVTAGEGTGVVVATGDRTETGRIAGLLSKTVEISTPLTRRIAAFGRKLLWVIGGLSLAAFGIALLRGHDVFETFLAVVALAVGAIPEGLPAAVTIVLAIGVSRMARRKAIIRQLPAVETLGSTTVICSDKTGTLTMNRMTVGRVFAGGETHEVEEWEGRGAVEGVALNECLLAGVLCNEARLVEGGGDGARAEGDPTEVALLKAGEAAGIEACAARESMPRVDMIPFDSGHMFRATLHKTSAGAVIYQVGAVERVLERCGRMMAGNGAEVPLDPEGVRAAAEAMATEGLRVLALARRTGGHVEGGLDHRHVEDGFTLLGLQGMIDPPRPEAVRAVAECRAAGIMVKMITGDHEITARAIAAVTGLGTEGRIRSITGRELAEVDEEGLPGLVERTDVFARVEPEQKLRLVEALQRRGHVVAMTGDGVNDAPALRQADIGIAMGISGTEVAKGAADMILTDDNFASIEAAVEEGRAVFDNLLKFIVWTIPTNLGEGGIVFCSILLGLPLPVLPVQLLWINMTTAIFLGLMLVFEPKEEGLMRRAPRDPGAPLLGPALIMRTVVTAGVMVVGGFAVFHLLGGTPAARTAVANVIVFVEAAYLFSCRSLVNPLATMAFSSNLYVPAGVLAMAGAQALFTYSPLMHGWFGTAPLEAGAWWPVAASAVVALVLVEAMKWFGRRA
jgi:cation-transporting P-type ATPase F